MLSLFGSGPEFLLNSFTTGYQSTANVDADVDGNFVAVWTSNLQDGSGTGIYARRFDSGGMPADTEFRVNTYTTGNQGTAAIAMDADGDFVVVWDSMGQDDSGYGIYGQRFDSFGAPQGSEFRVNSYTTKNQRNAAVAMDAMGSFVVTWDSYDQEEDGWGYGVYAQRYNFDGTPQGSEFRVNTIADDNQAKSSVAMDALGNFIVVWDGWEDPVDDRSGIHAQRFDSAGMPQGVEFLINSQIIGVQSSASVAMTPDGRFVVAWGSDNGDGSGKAVRAQRFNSNGAAQGSEFGVNTYTTGNQATAAVAMDAEGDFVVTWNNGRQVSGAYDIDVFAQAFRADGSALGSEFQVNTYTHANQLRPRIASGAAGNVVIAWGSVGQDGSIQGIYAQRYVMGPAVINASFDIDSVPQRLIFSFNRDVSASLTVEDLLVESLSGGLAPTLMMLPYGTDGPNTASFTIQPDLQASADGNYRVTVLGAGITAVPDSATADDYVFDFFILGGDTNRDRRVDLYDLIVVATNWQATGKGFSQGDFDHNGVVNSADLGILATHWQQFLEGPSPPLASVAMTIRPRAPVRRPTRIDSAAASLLR